MKLMSYKRLLKTDFKKDDQELVDQMSNSLNSGIEFLYQLANKRISIADNLMATRRDVEVRVDSNGFLTSDTFATVDFGSAVQDVQVGKVENLTNSNIYPTSAPFVIWNNTTTGIQFIKVLGLPAGNIFRLRIIMTG